MNTNIFPYTRTAKFYVLQLKKVHRFSGVGLLAVILRRITLAIQRDPYTEVSLVLKKSCHKFKDFKCDQRRNRCNR
jgi:hypothetical protein